MSEARVSNLPEAARAFADRVSDPAADLLSSALGTSERLGSRNLSEVLDALAEATTAQAAAVREARARQTRNRMSARIVAAVPILLLLAIRQANPAYLAPFETASGQAVLAFAFVLIWAGLRGDAARRSHRGERPMTEVLVFGALFGAGDAPGPYRPAGRRPPAEPRPATCRARAGTRPRSRARQPSRCSARDCSRRA